VMKSRARDQSPMVTSEERVPEARTRGAPTFDEIYRAEFAYIWRTLRRLGVPEKDVEDLTHDVFVVVSRRLHDYDVSRPLKPWLFGIAFRLASEDRRRVRNRVELLGEGFEARDGAPSAVELLEADERRQLVLDCLQTLDLDQRAAMILVDIDGESPTEVAAALGIPLPTVYSRLRIGRTRFAAAVRRAKLRQGEI
jgi:RNA polymerase sigma-70 factor (ECF subfamily)